MIKEWIFNGVSYKLEKLRGYGSYLLNGYHYTNSSVWDDVDSENEDKRLIAMMSAEFFVDTKF